MTEPVAPLASEPNRAALWSLVLGIVSIPAIGVFGSGGLLGIGATTLGVFGLRGARAGRGRGWMAIAGMVLGTIAALVIVGYLIFLLTDDKPGLSS